MKKNKQSLWALALMAVPFALQSCSKSEVQPDSDAKGNYLKGKWRVQQEVVEAMLFGESTARRYVVDNLSNALIIFNKNQMGWWEYSSGERSNFSYKVSGSVLQLDKNYLHIKSASANDLTLNRTDWQMKDTLFIGSTPVGLIKNYEIAFEKAD